MEYLSLETYYHRRRKAGIRATDPQHVFANNLFHLCDAHGALVEEIRIMTQELYDQYRTYILFKPTRARADGKYLSFLRPPGPFSFDGHAVIDSLKQRVRVFVDAEGKEWVRARVTMALSEVPLFLCNSDIIKDPFLIDGLCLRVVTLQRYGKPWQGMKAVTQELIPRSVIEDCDRLDLTVCEIVERMLSKLGDTRFCCYVTRTSVGMVNPLMDRLMPDHDQHLIKTATQINL